jgi:hypothetical protein
MLDGPAPSSRHQDERTNTYQNGTVRSLCPSLGPALSYYYDTSGSVGQYVEVRIFACFLGGVSVREHSAGGSAATSWTSR